jgi:hypothetical protein
MSALTPLYLLGVLAVAAPIVFHLIRRAPRGEVPFSSLLFLTPSPPKLTRRSRLDHILLLLLRAAVLCLLAFAFARPFLREKAEWSFGEDTQRRTAILVDTSASVHRGEIWNKVKEEARRAVADCRPTEELALLAFDRTSRPVLGFRESAALDAGKRQALALARIDALQPSWGATDLGQALIDAVAAIEDISDKSERAGRMPRRVVLISDLQQGSRLEALGEFEWPKDVELQVKTVADDASNAGLQRLPDPQDGAPGGDREPRVRVFNDLESRRERFSLQWTGPRGIALGDRIDVYVPPGESRVVRVPRTKSPAPVESIVLRGDSAPFDNTLFVLDEPRQEASVLFIGDDRPDDKEGLLYYLLRVFIDTPRRSVKVVSQPPTAPIAIDPRHPVSLVILAADTSPEIARRLRDQAQAGATLLYVATKPSNGQTLATLLDVPARPIEDASSATDALLGEIAFDHPLFAPFASPQYSDFTKIHFWKHRKLWDDNASGKDAATREGEAHREGEAPSEPSSKLARAEARPPEPSTKTARPPEVARPAVDQVRVLARFEKGDPAVMEKPLGKGSLVIMASGWSRNDSQLARSSKFVPLMMAMLDRHDPRPFEVEDHTVGDRIVLQPPKDSTTRLVVQKPSGTVVSMEPGSSSFEQTDEPGVYTVATVDGPRSFVVNLDPSESKTSALNVETLEQYGCRLSNPTRDQVDQEQLRQLHNAELEARQKLWRWLIVAAIGILIVETGLAGRIKRARPAYAQAEALSS